MKRKVTPRMRSKLRRRHLVERLRELKEICETPIPLYTFQDVQTVHNNVIPVSVEFPISRRGDRQHLISIAINNTAKQLVRHVLDNNLYTIESVPPTEYERNNHLDRVRIRFMVLKPN